MKVSTPTSASVVSPHLLLLLLLFSLFLSVFCPLTSAQLSVTSTIPPNVDYQSLIMKGVTGTSTKLFAQSALSAYQVQNPALKTELAIYSTIGEMFPLLVDGKIDFIIASGLQSVKLRNQYTNIGIYPLAANAMVLIFNLPDITGSLNLIVDGPTMCRMYTGNVTNWNDPRLRELNPGVTLPSTRISLVTINSPSGSAYSFSYYCYRLIPEEWVGAGLIFGRLPVFPKNYSAAGNWEEMTTIVMDKVGAVAFLPYPVAMSSGNQIAWMKNKAGQIVQPVSTAVAATIIELATDGKQRDNHRQ